MFCFANPVNLVSELVLHSVIYIPVYTVHTHVDSDTTQL